MTDLRYLMFIWKNHRGLAIFSVIFITALQVLLINLITSMDVEPILSTLLKQLPRSFQNLINEEMLTRFSLRGAAAFGLNHPFVLALIAIMAINIPARHIAGEIESGTLELILAYPVTRSQLLISLWISAALLLLLVVIGAFAGSLAAIAIFQQLPFDLFLKMSQISGNLWLLSLLIMTYTLLLSTLGKEGNKVGIRSAIITLLFYFVNFVSTLWDSIAFLKPFTIFAYYHPQKLMFDQRSFWLNAGVLAALTIVCLIIGIRQFNRRDIP